MKLMQPDPAVINKWTESAPYWEKHRETIRHMFSPISEALSAEAAIVPGDSVLDVACGQGEPALSLSSKVGASGMVRGVDPIPGMVEAAQREAERQGLHNIAFDVAFADNLPYPDATFDAVVSRFGVMFFASPAAGIREMLRVLKPGGKLAVAVWCSVDENPFHSVLAKVMKKYVDSPVLPPDAPDAFRFAEQGKLRDVFLEAGAVNPTEQLLRCTIEAPMSAESFLEVRKDMSDKMRERFAGFSPEMHGQVTSEATDAIQAYPTGSGLSFPAAVWILSAVR